MAYPSTAQVAAMTAKIEAAPGTFESLSTSTDGVQLGTDLVIRTNFGKLSRGIIKSYFNGDETIGGFAFVEVSFSFELAGAGLAGDVPAWGKFLRAAGFAEAITAGVKVDYTPVSSAHESLSMQVYYAGIRRSFRNLRASAIEFMAEVNTIPKARITLVGLERVEPLDFAEAAMASTTLTMWKVPRSVSAFGGTILFGASYNNSTGAVTGGNPYPSKGLRVSVSNTCTPRPVLGWSDYTPITGRTATATASLDLPPADRVTFYSNCKTATMQSMAQSFGGSSGAIVRLLASRAEPMDLTDEDDAGLQFDQWQFALRPNNGNDELRVVVM